MPAVRLRDIAQRAGVHPSTVSRVLNGDANARLSPGTRERILQVALETGYRPNRLGRSLRLQRTNLLGMLVPDVTNPFFSHIFRAVEDLAVEHGFSLLLSNTDDSPGRAARHLAMLGEGHVDGVLLATAHRQDPAIDQVVRLGIPYVLINRRRDDPGDWWVVSDDYGGAVSVVQHLAALGHTRIAHLHGPEQISTAANRLAGYRDGLKRAGLALDGSLLVQGGFTEDTGWRAMLRMLELPASRRPTAVFAANDLAAIGAMRAIGEAGLSVPEDISLVGYNDIPLASRMAPSLTTVRIPLAEMGRLAAELLIRRVRKEVPPETQIIVPVTLIERSSTAPAFSSDG